MQKIIFLSKVVLVACLFHTPVPPQQYGIFIVDGFANLIGSMVVFRGFTVRSLVITNWGPISEFGRVTVTTVKLDQLSLI